MSVKEPWCSRGWLNGFLKHGKGGVTRCPAMMSSIGALCGSQACHSFTPPPPGVCFCVSMRACVCVLLITPYHKSNSFSVAQWGNKLVGGGSHTNMRKAPASSSHGYATVPLKNSASGCSIVSAHPLILSHNTHSFSLIPFGQHTPLEKSPNHSLQRSTQVPSHSLAFTRWNIPEKREKTPGRHKFLLFSFFHFSPSLHSISKSKNKQRPLTDWKTVELHHTDPLCPWCSSKAPKISCEGQVGVTDTLHPTPRPASPDIDPLCVNVWGSVLLRGGVFRVRWVCLGVHWACMFLELGCVNGWSV